MSSFKDILNGVMIKLNQAVQDISRPAQFVKYANKAADEVRLRTRLGYGVDRPEASKRKLKRLAPSTIKSRGYKKNRGDLSDKTNPNASNLTDTGQMLDALKGIATGTGKGAVVFDESRDDGKTNSEVASYAPELGRPFMNMSQQEIDRITNEIRKDLIKSVRSRLNK